MSKPENARPSIKIGREQFWKKQRSFSIKKPRKDFEVHNFSPEETKIKKVEEEIKIKQRLVRLNARRSVETPRRTEEKEKEDPRPSKKDCQEERKEGWKRR